MSNCRGFKSTIKFLVLKATGNVSDREIKYDREVLDTKRVPAKRTLTVNLANEEEEKIHMNI